MHEQRKYFRIKSEGDILAFFANQALEIIDLSAASILVTNDVKLPPTGVIDLKINHTFTYMSYKILRTNKDNSIVLLFDQEDQIEQLFTTLRNLRR